MYRTFLLATLFVGLAAGCWENEPMAVTFPTKTGDWRDNPMRVGPNDWRLMWASDMVKGDPIVAEIELDGGKFGQLMTIVGDTYTFMMENPGHGIEVNDKIDVHFEVTGAEPYQVRFAMTVTSVLSIEIQATGGYGPRPKYTPRDAVLCKPQDLDIADFQGKDVTKCRMWATNPCGVRPLSGDTELGSIVVPPVSTTAAEYEWSWEDGISPAWKTSLVTKLRCSNGRSQSCTLQMRFFRHGPRYTVYKNGVPIADNTICNWEEFSLVPGETSTIFVHDQSYIGPPPEPNPRMLLGWDPAGSGPDVDRYRVERYQDAAWITLGEMAHDPACQRYSYETPALANTCGCSELFRVVPVGPTGDGTPQQVSMSMARTPPPPDVETTFSDATKKFTIEEDD